MKDYYLWFLVIFVMVAACVVSYKSGYGTGFDKGTASVYPARNVVCHDGKCEVVDPHDQKDYDRPDKENTPQGEENVTR
jgi:hypothetical protein